jgi:uncharacterized membrane protein YhhN
MKIGTLIAFIIFSLGVLASHIFNLPDGLPGLNFVCKPMLMMMLFFYLFWSAYKNWLDEESKMALALVGAWLGDIFLMVKGSPLFFQLGILSFLVMQLYYISAFRFSGMIYIPLTAEEDQQNALVRANRRAGLPPPKDTVGNDLTIVEPKEVQGFLQRYKYAAIPFILAGGALFYIVQPQVPSMVLKIAILIYASALVTMVLAALNRGGRVPQNSFVMVLVGAIMFLISDAVIAINQFLYIQPTGKALPYADLIIMGLYIPAQFLIVEGFLRQGKVKVP